MDLFTGDSSANLLPDDGIANYHGPIFTAPEAAAAFESLKAGIPWRRDEIMMFGKRIVTAREVAWFGDEPFAYTYSGATKEALLWTPELRALKTRVEEASQAKYNSCLLNFYHDGGEGMSWHSDDEPTMAANQPIASVSLGAARKFSFKHKQSGETVSLLLEPGSLLVMRGETQANWLHALPKSKAVSGARINLTFRTFVGPA